MNVLSLFDGMSCGQIALDQLGIKVKNYFAAEIDKYAIQVAKSNYPDMVHLGDVREIWVSNSYEGAIGGSPCTTGIDHKGKTHKIDLLIGGSPCQGFSFAGKQLNFDDPQSQLFFEYVRLLKALKPKYFLLENVRMNKKSMDVISEYLGVEPIAINSNLVSAQNRYRLYWTNIPMEGLPQDKGIMLKDILEPVEQIDDVYYYSAKSIAYMERGNEKWQQAGAKRADRYTQTPDTKKAFTITANFYKGVPYNYFDDNSVDTKHIRKLTVKECERLQTVPDGYTCGVSNSQRYKMLGNGWTVDVIKHIFNGLETV